MAAEKRASTPFPLFQPASDHSLLISFGKEISHAHYRTVSSVTRKLLRSLPDFVLDIHPAYASILVVFDPLRATFQMVESSMRLLLAGEVGDPSSAVRTVEVPVCYDPEFGPDLDDVAARNRLSREEAVEIHSGGSYFVCFIGFTPGFPYLGGMSQRIAAARLSSPRTRVPAGSVAIGGDQTGIYPIASPGGWRIIGRTPLRLFAPERDPPSLLAIGDEVRFQKISRGEFDRFPEEDRCRR